MHQQPRDRSKENSLFSQGRHQAGALDPEVVAVAAPSDLLDDVFAADGDADAHEAMLEAAPASTHPTDMSRLQAEHNNAGYLEGVTLAKAANIQPGFDEGFSLGATIGQAAGHLIGILEGISSALAPVGGDAAAEAERLLGQAREELSIKGIFSPDYWAPDGNWTYPVEPADGAKREEVLFPDVAAAHPLIRKWTGVVDGEVKRWNIRLDILHDEMGPRMEAISDEQTKPSVVQKTNKALDW